MPPPLPSELLTLDREHLWHPYASMTHPTPVRLVSGAAGVRITLHDDTELIDAMSSWWSAIHGYRHPILDEAMRHQIATMSHVMFGGLTHQPAVTLARLLVELSPDPLRHVFLADSGSVAVEVALKMAAQYQRGQGRPGRTRTLALRGGYHGDTLGAMSVCDPIGGMHAMFADSLPLQVFAPQPPAGYEADTADWEAETRALASARADELAAIICEPVLQGAGGMHIYNPHCLRVLREVADEHGLVLIFDEIATGFGRTGTFFAAEQADVDPDIICVGKALTGGYLTLAAALCTSEVARGIGRSEAGVLVHGPTFMANPLACAAAVASIQMLLRQRWQHEVRRLEAGLRAGLEPARGLPGVADVRVLGAVGVIQLDRRVDVVRASDIAADNGVWIRPFRDLVYTMPAYVMDDIDLAQVCAAMVAAADA
ncbi:MAG: adenosylmethionine--8-amino-7-oxononanoate transaminase [Nocardioidaceae bacterium]